MKQTASSLKNSSSEFMLVLVRQAKNKGREDKNQKYKK